MLAAVLREQLKREGVRVVIDIRPCGDPADGQRRFRLHQRDLTAFLYQRDGDYCIDTISSRWAAEGANVWGAGGRYPSAECGLIVL
jgi:hypothetical protein